MPMVGHNRPPVAPPPIRSAIPEGQPVFLLKKARSNPLSSIDFGGKKGTL